MTVSGRNPIVPSRARHDASMERKGASRAIPDSSEFMFYLYLLLLFVEFVGLANSIPLLKLLRFSTLLAYGLFVLVLQRVGVTGVLNTPQGRLHAAFVGFTGLSVLYALVTMQALTALRAHVDYFALFVLTLHLVDRPSRVRKLAGAASVIALVLVFRNLDHLTSLVRAGSYRAGNFLGDGNDFAWGLNVLLPLTLFLTISRQTTAWRLLGAAGLTASILGIVGTQSRGGALALAMAATFYWMFAVKRKTLGVVAFAIVIVGVLATAPSQYWERLRTIQQYQQDNSARTRLQVWGAAVQMAVDYPLGVGANNFGSVYGRFYIPDDQNSMIDWGRNRWLSAHSVYFRLLGEYGVLGVLWVFLLLATNWRDNFATRARLASVPAAPGDGLPSEWPLILNMSLVGYAVSGIFLGGVTYPYLYLLSAWTASARRQSLWQKAGEEATTATPLALATPAGPIGPRWTQLQPLGPQAVVERARIIMQKRPHAS